MDKQGSTHFWNLKLGIWLILAIIFCGCSHNSSDSGIRSMYYWSTTFSLSDTQLEFINNHNVKRIYLRYFDVALNESSVPMPNASCIFKSTVADTIEIIPTIFITNDVMAQAHDSLAERIFKRVLQMSETNDVKNVHELQIDCDWTRSTEKTYFAFLSELRDMLHKEGLQLSTTIRLHQLSLTPPPADRGVLMVYNTGDFRNPDCKKPILNPQDVLPYIKGLPNYKLPLSTALPVFSWKILFRQRHFVGIIHFDDEYPILSGDSIALTQPTMEDITETKHILRCRENVQDEVILFDMGESNINRFNDNDYETIFNP